MSVGSRRATVALLTLITLVFAAAPWSKVAPVAASSGGVQGHVYDLNGTPVPSASVNLRDGGPTDVSVRTDATGFYQIIGIDPGTYQLCAMDPEEGMHRICDDSLQIDTWVVERDLQFTDYVFTGGSPEPSLSPEPSMTPAPTATPASASAFVSGQLLDQIGDPIAGNVVDLYTGAGVVDSRTTDAAGGYSFGPVEAAEYWLQTHVSSISRNVTSLRFWLADGETKIVDLQVPSGGLNGTVSSADGTAAAGVFVNVCGPLPDIQWCHNDATDSAGFYELLHVSAVDVEIWVSNSSEQLQFAHGSYYTYATVDHTVQTLDLQLAAPATAFVTGQLLDAAGDPIADNVVYLLRPGFGGVASSVTDALGSYSFGPVPPADYSLQTHVMAVERDLFSPLFSLLDGETEVVNLQLPSGGLNGTVTLGDGSRANGVIVSVCGPHPDSSLSWCYMDTTDADGFYEALHLPAVSVEVSVTNSSFEQRQLADGSYYAYATLDQTVQMLDLQLADSGASSPEPTPLATPSATPTPAPAPFIYGQISAADGGELYGGHINICLDAECNSFVDQVSWEADGAYQTSGLAPGDYHLVVHPYSQDGGARYLLGQTVLVTVGESPAQRDFTLALAPLTTVQGHITFGEGGPPAPGIGVAACFEQITCVAPGWNVAIGPGAVYGETDANGFYQLSNVPVLASGGEIAYRDPANGVNVLSHSGGFGEPVHVHDIAIKRASGGVDGTFLYADGTPVAGADVYWFATEAGEPVGEAFYVEPTAADGTFAIRGLEPGTYQVIGEDLASRRSVSASLTVGTAIESVVLQHGPLPTGGLRLIVRDHLGALVEGWYVDGCYQTGPDRGACFWGQTDANGEYEIFYLDPTPVSGRAYSPDFETYVAYSTNVESALVVLELMLPPPPTGVITGTASEGGSALAWTWVTACLAGGDCVETMTDGAGHFQFDRLHAGDYYLSVSLDQQYADPASPVSVGTDTVAHDIVLALGAVTGYVSAGGTAVSSGYVQACHATLGCVGGYTDGAGFFRIGRLPAGDYKLTAYPTLSDYLPTTLAGTVTVATTDADAGTIDLQAVQPLPADGSTTISGEGVSSSPGTVPTAWSNTPVTLTTTACAGGAGTYTVTSVYDPSHVLTGAMTETAAGHYEAVVTFHFGGPAQIDLSVACPDPADDTTVTFNVYIDPSGWVRNTLGEPIVGATVVLYRAPTPAGPWSQVPDGSDIMSPSNRTNPDLTDDEGHFGWDVIAGYYKVRTFADGCVNAAKRDLGYAETRVYEIPPPVFDIDLRLYCGEGPPPDVTDPSVAIAAPLDGADYLLGSTVVADYACADETGGSGLATCVGDVAVGDLLDTATVGAHSFRVTAHDVAGNSTVVTVTYRVVYDFGGFHRLAAAPEFNPATAAQTVNLMFELAGDHGMGVVSAVGSRSVSCLTGAPAGELSMTGFRELKYDPAEDRYKIGWKTAKAWAGSCREVVLALDDGTAHAILFEFRKKGK